MLKFNIYVNFANIYGSSGIDKLPILDLIVIINNINSIISSNKLMKINLNQCN